jgi:hypothetical protein
MPSSFNRCSALAGREPWQVTILRFKGVSIERPAVAEDDGLSFAPVLKIDLRAVLSGDGARRFSSATFRSDCAQWFASFLSWGLTFRSLLPGRGTSVVRGCAERLMRPVVEAP